MPSQHRSRRHQRLAELIAQHRRDAGLTQTDVAQALGRYQPLITGMENGQRRIDVVELLELAEMIDFDPHRLLDELKKIPKT